jgi:release factor glutamine methyltransferase
MKLKDVLDRTIQFFKDKKIDQPRLEAEWLIAGGLGLNRVDLYMRYEQPLKEDEVHKLRDFVRRRALGEPLAYITGARGFYKLDFKVTPAVLIPRPETEILVERALDWIQEQLKQQELVRVLDLGCGSGCIGLTIAYECPKARVDLVDVSPEALKVAQENAKNWAVDGRCTFHLGDAVEIAEQLQPGYHLILANPPYIEPNDPEIQESVKKFEPPLALFADGGTSLLKKWSQKYSQKISPPGLMMMEMGFKQGAEMREFYQGISKFSDVQILQDYSGLDRFIQGKTYG